MTHTLYACTDSPTVSPPLRLLGYKVVNGVLEKEELFRDRMSGFVKLYAAVTQTKPIMRLVRYYQFYNNYKFAFSFVSRILMGLRMGGL